MLLPLHDEPNQQLLRQDMHAKRTLFVGRLMQITSLALFALQLHDITVNNMDGYRVAQTLCAAGCVVLSIVVADSIQTR